MINLLNVLVWSSCSIVLLISVLIAITLLRLKYKYGKSRKSRTDQKVVAFFHPYCSAGGGGEKVLWIAVDTLINRYQNLDIHIYTGDLELCPEAILKRVSNVFGITLNKNDVSFVYLRRRKWIEPSMYNYFTLLGQSLGSVWLAFEALSKLQPDVVIDTMGQSFVYPLFKYIGGAKVACYTHYPIITSEMMKKVYCRVPSHNNRRFIANNPLVTSVKLIYYNIFAKIYCWTGNCTDCIMVNSSWTEEHIRDVWNLQPNQVHKVYPPCDTAHLKMLKRRPSPDGKIKIVSIGQFRPEKDHPLQLRALYELRSIISEELFAKISLVFVGSCRNQDDKDRVKDMRDLCKHLSLENNVEFKINCPYEELCKELSEGTIGLHTMWNEHFGIAVVECMAAGLIMVAHKSGGPLQDIVETSEPSRNGLLATTDREYACAIKTILYLPDSQKTAIAMAARSSVDRFSVNEFTNAFLRVTAPLFT